jgi:hypothetical protein
MEYVCSGVWLCDSGYNQVADKCVSSEELASAEAARLAQPKAIGA